MTSQPSRFFRRIISMVGWIVVGWTGSGLTQEGAAPPLSSVAPHITAQPSSTSASGQFVVHGSDLATRSAFCLLCDDTASALGHLLRDNGRFAIPVVVVLKAPPDVDRTGPPITTNISQLAHGGFHLQINANLRSDFESDEFARELVRVLMAERILRNHTELTTKRDRVLPDWVLTGVTQALEFRSRSKPSAMFAAVFRGGQVFSVDKILTADPAQLDALSRAIYESSACAIVLALLDQQDGPVRFGRFLNALALDNKSDRELLKEHFPTLGVSKNSLEKWWSLQMATLATPSALETMSVAQTEEKLDEALTLRYEPLPDKKGKGGKDEDKEKTAMAAPAKDGFPMDRLAQTPSGALIFTLRDLLDAIISGQEVAAAPAKDADADAPADKKTKKKDAEKPKKEEPKPAEKKPAEKPKKDEAKPADKPKKEEPKPADKKPADKPKKEEPKPAEKKPAEKPKKDEPKPADKKPADKPKKEEPKPAEKKEPEKPKKEEPAPDKKDTKEPDKKTADKTQELRAKPHRIAQRPANLPTPAPDDKPKDEPKPSPKEKEREKEKPPVEELAKTKDSKPGAEEKPTADKRNNWNPLNWFKKGEKPEPETAEKTPATKHPRTNKPTYKPNGTPEEIAAQGSVEDYLTIWKRPDRAKILQRNFELLAALKNQAHPLYRPLITDYLDAVRGLIQGKDHGIAEKLTALHTQYVKIGGEAKAVESYLDWYQASETPNYSGAFDDYLKMRDKLEKEIRPRGDAISQYLDFLEKEYEN